MNFQIITTTQQLEDVCHKAKQVDTVMLDTEFVRTRTYYPILGLIQLYDGEHLSLIDPLEIQDMSAFADLLQDESVMKVLHACGEDLEVFQHSFGCLPTPMRDTQLMAAFLGHGLSTGFATLVNEYLCVELDKSESRTDWCARPLTPKQLDYAAADVYYLLPLYQKLEQAVTDANWLAAADQESSLLKRKRIKNINPDLVYKQVKGAWQLTPRQLAILKPIATWRFLEAKSRNLALNFVLKEGDMLSVCRQEMTSLNQMKQADIDNRTVRRHGDALLAMVQQGLAVPEEELPTPIERLADDPKYKQTLKSLKDIVTSVHEKTGLATEFLASKKQLNQLITWVWRKDKQGQAPDVMQGWRLELFGERLLAKLEA
ncbi:MAG: ribonuclease D [Vibrio sp.]